MSEGNALISGVAAKYWRAASQVSLLLMTLGGCSLDARQLRTAPAGGGAPAGSLGGHSGGDDPMAMAAGGAAGEPGTSESCPDIDGNGVGDCEETLLANANFARDVQSWTAEGGAALAWDAENATLDLPSGSALLTAPNVEGSAAAGGGTFAAKQCVKIAGEQLVTVYADVWVGGDQDSKSYGKVEVYFFDSDACVGPYLTNFVTPQPLEAMPGAWQLLKAGALSGQNTRSGLVKLALGSPAFVTPLAARFDNVLLKVQRP